MSVKQRRYQIVALMAALNLCVPWNVVAAKPVGTNQAFGQSHVKIVDISLSENGQLAGQMFDQSGRTVEFVEVGLVKDGKLVSLTTSDASGRFVLDDVAGGSYQLAAAGAQQAVRAWAAQTAPPVAQTSALLVVGDDVVRGQQGCGDGVGCGDSVGGYGGGYGYRESALVRWMRANPGMVLVGVAAAIAIPIAIVASDDDNS